MNNTPQPTAAIVAIGNELLSGRTQDKNINYIAQELNELGIKLVEVRIIPDNHEVIIRTLQEFSSQCDYVFTTGGIGPTHDDITTECVAKACNTTLSLNEEAKRLLDEYYQREGRELNDARLKMAYLPIGAELIINQVSGAPGYRLGNIYVLAGVPRIMQAMFQALKPQLTTGPKTANAVISALVAEGDIAKPLSDVQDLYTQVEIGSYPFRYDDNYGTSLVFRGIDAALVEEAAALIRSFLQEKGIKITEDYQDK